MSLTVLGISYAFFTPDITTTGSINVDVETSNNAKIIYDTGDALNLFANQPGASDEAVFSVTLSGDVSYAVTSEYDINWNITENGFSYEENDETIDAELTYDIYTSNDGLSWTPYILNQDCTAKTGNISLVNGHTISVAANSSITQYWKVVLTFEDLEKNQSYNQNKTLKSTLKISNVN